MTRNAQLTFIDHPSPNFNDRNGQAVQILVLHYTAMDNAADAIQRLCDPAAEVSAHYVVDKQGAIYRLVQEDKRAWHAGISFWDGHTDLNSSSIGIEIDNTGSEPYNQVQMDSVLVLSRDIVSRYKMRSIYVVAHSDIAPDRKQDPGNLFDWPGLAAAGVGIYPAPTQVDYAASAKWSAQDVTNALSKLGYKSGIDAPTLITAFQRHFQPAVFQPNGQPGTADPETKARLANLLRRKNISDAMRAASAKRRSSVRK